MFVFHWLLIQSKIIQNRFKQNMREFILRDVWHTLIIVFGLALLYVFLTVMFSFMDKRGLSSFDFAFVLLSFSLLVFLPLLLYSAIVCSLSFLFQKEELQFYFSLPLKRLSVFTVKFLQTYFHTNWMVFLGFLTFLAALQAHFKTTPLMYLTGGISFLIFLLIPVCVAVMLVIIISRFVPFVQSRGILTVIGLLTGSILLCAIRVMQPEQLVTAEGKLRLVTFIQNLYRPWMTALPSEWMTSILFAQSQNNLRAMVINFAGLCIVASLAVAMTYVVAQLYYKRVWAEAVVTSPAFRRQGAWKMLLNGFPASVHGFLKKDLLSFSRDTMEKGSLLTLIPLSFVYLYSMYILNRHVQNTHEEQVFSFLYVYLFNFFYASVVIAGLSGRWVLPSLSSEGNNFKLIKKSPAPLRDLLKAKFLLGFIPLLFLGEMLVVSSSVLLHFPLHFVLLSAVTMGILCWGITLICLIVGMREADFTITSTLDYALSMRGFQCLTWELAFVMIILGAVGLPTALILYGGASPLPVFTVLASLSVTGIMILALSRMYASSLVKLSRMEV